MKQALKYGWAVFKIGVLAAIGLSFAYSVGYQIGSL